VFLCRLVILCEVNRVRLQQDVGVVSSPLVHCECLLMFRVLYELL